MNILVSACLLGAPCRYNGVSKPDESVRRLEERGHRLIPVCPEQLGGLPIPRPPAERQPDGRVVNREGVDVTCAFHAGAERTLAIARENGCALAVLKEKSPSCGSGLIYDGSFCGKLVPGWGTAARLLERNGIRVIGESRTGEIK